MSFGSIAPYAKRRNENQMKINIKQSELFPGPGPTSTAWLHKKHLLVQRGNEGNLARDYRISQENLLTARLNEEKQISDLTTARRPGLIGEGGRVRAATRAAAQVYNVMKF